MSTADFSRISCIILAAGDSVRMGKPKALLGFGKSGFSFLEKICHTYSDSGVRKIVVVAGQALFEVLSGSRAGLPNGIVLVRNPHPEYGRFYSLKTGLLRLVSGTSTFMQNVDNPFVTEAVLDQMVLHSGRADYILPEYSGKGGHPVLLNPVVCNDILNYRDHTIRIDRFLDSYEGFRLRTLDCGVLANINTPEDYSAFFGGNTNTGCRWCCGSKLPED